MIENRSYLSSQQDQLNFHKLLGCTCQIPEGKRFSTGRLFMSYKAVENQKETDGKNAEGFNSLFSASFLIIDRAHCLGLCLGTSSVLCDYLANAA